jgi:excisionase family DNA binding protein
VSSKRNHKIWLLNEIAADLRISRGTAANEFYRGRLPGLKVGRLIRVRDEDYQAYLKLIGQGTIRE